MRTAAAGRGLAPSASYASLAALLGGTFLMGFAGVGAVARPVFVLGCLVVSYATWRRSASAHLQMALILFCLAPFLRRVVDYSAGYDSMGLMLVGPLLAILVPTFDLRELFRPGRSADPALRPFGIMGCCIAYATLVTLIQGDLVGAASGVLKWAAPLLYSVWLYERARTDVNLVPAAVRAFLIVMPILGAYGVLQYVAPPAWDRYWMIFAPVDSIGYPEPYQVRVFSTMNSPASYATYTMCGLLLVGFCRSGWSAALLGLPCTLGLLLSLYRTAWITLVAAVLFCLLFQATRRRGALLTMGGAIAVVVAAVATPFGDVITDRLESFSQGSQDGSARERLQEFVTMLNADGGTLLGHGFVWVDDGRIGLLIDGQIIGCWYIMGLVVGMICLTAIIWAAWQGMARVAGSRDPTRIVLGAVMAGSMAQLPLGGVASGEAGFLFWTFAAIAAAGVPHVDVRSRAPGGGQALVLQRAALRGRA